jgi:capsular exopolysaccharide synthesis family protein
MLDAPSTAGTAEAPSAERTGFSLAPGKRFAGIPPGAAEKLVVTAASGEQVVLAMAIEQYRKLAATLHHAQGDRGLKVILVASANPGEGKSLTASNLALTLSESYQRRVLLIDADLRRPSLHGIFGVPNDTGLSDGLARASIEGLMVVEISPRLSVLPSGRPMEDPTSALTSDQMRRILDEARACYDWAIIDTPPIGMLSDARLLAEMVDGVVLVVEAERSPYPDLLRAIDTIGRERVLGAVLNRLRQVPGGSHYYASYYGHSQAPKA